MDSIPHHLNPVKSSEHTFIQTLLYPITSIVQLLYKLLSITIVYTNLEFNLSSLTFLVPMSNNFRPPKETLALQ